MNECKIGKRERRQAEPSRRDRCVKTESGGDGDWEQCVIEIGLQGDREVRNRDRRREEDKNSSAEMEQMQK